MSLYAIKEYHNEVEKIIHYGGTKKETAIRNAFYTLLNKYADSRDLILIPEISLKTKAGKIVTPDGTLKDVLRLDHGYWESKDESDDINEEIRKKFDKGYPNENILFEDSQTAVLFQQGSEVLRVPMQDGEELDKLLNRFINYEREEVKEFRDAIDHFKEDIPKVTDAIKGIIDKQESNEAYLKTLLAYHELCKVSINPEITIDDVKEMMLQHILSADIFNTIFDEPHFHQENNIARELNKVVETFFTGAARRETLGRIKHYYDTINAAAAGIADHHEKQKFLKVVYETFYKAYNPKAADRLGIVYTPNEIVAFMIRSTDYLLHKHFGKTLDSKNVEILDPATGTGTFICDIIDYLPKHKLKHKYKNELHANELAILPYYIANLNIEYVYKQKMQEYAEFENLCLVDTLDNTGFHWIGKQGDLFGVSAENAARIRKQNEKKISVIIGNPPYNAKQGNYNYQNANRLYKEIDKRIKDTFIKYGTAQNQIVVYDMYTRFYRWAMDRLNENGVIALVTNRSFIDGRAFDGFRKAIQQDFDFAYVIDTRSDVRANPKIAGTTHNVFGIQTGIAIMFLVKNSSGKIKPHPCRIEYVSMQDEWRKEEKLQWLVEYTIDKIPFESVSPDKRNNWINQNENEWDELIPLVSKEAKSGKNEKAVFKLFSNGIKSQRDEWVYDFSEHYLAKKMKVFVDVYNTAITNNKADFEIKWDRELSKYLSNKIPKEFEKGKIVLAQYRPFVKMYLYFDKHFNGQPYQWFELYQGSKDNKYIAINSSGNTKDFFCMPANTICDLHLTGDSQCLPLNRYTSSGERVNNISDWAVNIFRDYYKTDVTKDEIFYYVYAVLNDPAYREKYMQNLKREFPRIPLYENFTRWSKWGEHLMNLHLYYEKAHPYNLQLIELISTPLPKARLKAIKERGIIQLDENTELHGIPKEAWEYRLGNRSALEWILEQHKEKKPSDPTIAEKFNTYRFSDYKEQVIDLLRRVTTVSVETMKIIDEMNATYS